MRRLRLSAACTRVRTALVCGPHGPLLTLSAANAAVSARIRVRTAGWIARPPPTVDDYGVCGLCRALTPPNHHRGSRTGSGPGTENRVVKRRGRVWTGAGGGRAE